MRERERETREHFLSAILPHSSIPHTYNHQHASPIGRCVQRHDEQVITRCCRTRRHRTVLHCMPASLRTIFATLSFATSAASCVTDEAVCAVAVESADCMALEVGAACVHPPRVHCHPVTVWRDAFLEDAEPSGAKTHSPASNELRALCGEGGVSCHLQPAKSSRPKYSRATSSTKISSTECLLPRDCSSISSASCSSFAELLLSKGIL